MILGVIGSAMWQYDKFLYYSVFCVQAVILYILINYSSTSLNKDPDIKRNTANPKCKQ